MDTVSIPLCGATAVVDACDFERRITYRDRKGQKLLVRPCDVAWQYAPAKSAWYVRAAVKRSSHAAVTIYLHRLIAECPPHLYVDHIDFDPLNNRRSNLRVCTFLDNTRYRRRKPSKAGYRGVCWYRGKFYARITVNYKDICIGRFDDPADAAKAYDKKAKELFGEFAILNFN